MIKAAHAGLWFSLISSVALAQNAPAGAPAPVPPVASPGAVTPQAPGTMPEPQARGPGDPYEGEIIQTPNGAYVVAEPAGGEQDGVPEGRPDPGAAPHPHPRHMMPSKAAHIRLYGPDLRLEVKCPDDEPVKACADAVSQLMDKAAQAHH